MARKTAKNKAEAPSKRIARGFVQTGGILNQRIRKATEKRGFLETRLLTQWAEIAGAATASTCRPVKVSYGREGFGATLTLLTNGANAPLLQAQLPKICERVNACYGYAAISRIRLTQTAETGFAEAQASFSRTNAPIKDRLPRDVALSAPVSRSVAAVSSEPLRSALETLGRNILSRNPKR